MGSGQRSLQLAFVAIAITCTGCAYVTAVPVKPGSNVQGIRIYDVKPILIVDGATTQIHMVPNYNRAYALQFGAFLAKNDFQVKMSNGILSEVHANMDSTDFIKFLSDILKQVEAANGLSDVGTPSASTGVKDRFQVYDFVFEDNGNLKELKPLIYTSDLLKLQSPSNPRVAAAGGAAAEVIAQDSTDKSDGVNTGKVAD